MGTQHIFWIYLVLIFIFLQTSSAQTCRPGQFKKKGKCEDCPPGSFSEQVDSVRCNLCKPGTFSPFSGAPDIVLCRPCLEDTFAAVSGATECKPCPPGTMASRGFKECVKCGPGTRLTPPAERVRRTCEPCPKGQFSTGEANRECELCPMGMTGPRGSDSIKKCKRCPPGQWNGNCDPCFRGFFQNLSTGFCESCPAGMISKGGATRCRKCQEGTIPGFNNRARFTCVACKKGKTSGRGSSVCIEENQPCPARTFENNDGGCLGCSQGYIRNEVTNECEKCPLGSTSLGGIQNKCVVCTGELVPDTSNALCRCKKGLYFQGGKCFPCPPGTGGNADNPKLRGRNGCQKCQFGTFSAKPGSASCEKCPFGTVVEMESATKCMPCPEGFAPEFSIISNDESKFCTNVRTGCPEGLKSVFNFGPPCVPIE